MDFRTVVHIPRSGFSISHTNKLMLFGSCFSENIGKKLLENKFSVDVNPFGILYNPASVSAAIRRLLRKKTFTENDLVFHNDAYQSFLHHGSFSHPDKQRCLAQISDRFQKASESIHNADVLLITFGTAYVFQLKSDESIVGNCHKFPADKFTRRRLSIEEITDDWTALINELLTVNLALRFVFTVSPIRHFKDGAHENQLSKSILHLAIANLERQFATNVQYFPAYEIMMDELRDYRFYAPDMMHPSEMAVDYLWERFSETYFSKETQSVMRDWAAIYQALHHRPLNGFTDNYRTFLLQTKEKLNRFSQKYSFIACREEIEHINSILQTFKS